LDQITFDATVLNNGPSDAQTTQVAMTLPPGVTFVSATGGMTPVADVVTWDVGTLTVAAGLQTYSVVVDIDAATTGTLTPAVAVSSTTSDPDPGNDTYTAASTTVGAPLPQAHPRTH